MRIKRSDYLLSQQSLFVFRKGSAHCVGIWSHQWRQVWSIIFVFQEAFVSLGFLFFTAVSHVTIGVTKRCDRTQFISEKGVLNERQRLQIARQCFIFFMPEEQYQKCYILVNLGEEMILKPAFFSGLESFP